MNRLRAKKASKEAPNLHAFYFTDDPSAARWPLHPVSHAYPSGLLGWTLAHAPVEAGLDSLAARLLSEALCRCGYVTFFSSAADAARPPENLRPGPDSFARSLGFCSPPRANPSVALQCTREPAMLCQAFSDGAFSWSRQTQVLFLSQPDPPLNGPSEQDALCLLDRVQLPQTGWELRSHTRALVLPGVDGDFAELVFLDDHVRAAFLQQFAQVSAASGIAWHPCTAQQFNSVQWIEQSSAHLP